MKSSRVGLLRMDLSLFILYDIKQFYPKIKIYIAFFSLSPHFKKSHRSDLPSYDV